MPFSWFVYLTPSVLCSVHRETCRCRHLHGHECGVHDVHADEYDPWFVVLGQSSCVLVNIIC